MEKKKQSKKKLVLLTLLLFAVIGTVGYGVYSYYWTQGNFDNSSSGSENEIVIDADYDPEVITNTSSSTQSFLGNGGTLVLTCPERSGGKETINCTGTISVLNNGSSSIYVEVLDIEGYASSDDDGISVEAGTPQFNWTTTTISSKDRTNLTVTVPVTINNGTTGGLDSEDAEYVTGPVSGGNVSASVDFKLKSTQNN